MPSAVCALSMYKSLANTPIYVVKLCTSCLCMKMQSFLHLQACAMPQILYFYHVEFHFRFGHMIPFNIFSSLTLKTRMTKVEQARAILSILNIQRQALHQNRMEF